MSISTLCRANPYKTEDAHLLKGQDTSMMFSFQKKLQLADLRHTTESFHLRLDLGYGLIYDIQTSGHDHFQGFITAYCYLADKYPYDSIIYKRYELDSTQSRLLYSLWKVIADIPTDALVPGWGKDEKGDDIRCAHCTSTIVEISTPTEYTVKTFLTPNEQQLQIAEVRRFEAFVHAFESIFLPERTHAIFSSSLVPGVYCDANRYIHFIVGQAYDCEPELSPELNEKLWSSRWTSFPFR